ncbi:DUF262 domain-containing protein [Desulfotomaculum varum]
MKKIIGKEKSLIDLLANKKYTIHYYQREYRWGKKQIEELLADLAEEFQDNYEEDHEREQVEYYGHYYLGSVVLTSTDADNAIIDGQQRLTSLTLLLIYLNNLQQGRPDRVDIDSLIYSEKFGRKSFNIRVEEREPCLNALFKGEPYDPAGQPESVQNIYARYKDIEEIFPEELKGRALPFFIDWLIYKVYLVEITAHTEQDAHKIFVSMNDRGLSLTPTEMLKGYLLSEIKDDRQRNRANDLWKQKILDIKNLNPDSKEEDADFIKNWLRAQYAETIREQKKGAHPEDFDLIGTEFHKWVRENAGKIGLRRSQDYEDFVLKEFKLFADAYIKLKQCSSRLQPGYEYVYYNANRNFTLQYQLILAALDPQDDPDTIDRKIKAMSCFIDQYIAIRVFNFKVVDYSTIKNAVFNLTKKFRRLPLTELVDKLQEEIRQMEFTLDGIDKFHLNQFTGRYMLHILARMTHYIEQESGLSTQFENYVSRTIKNPYDIEHIWANQYSRHTAEFATEDEFSYYRNRFGGLLLLPRDKNRSYQDKSYQEKLPMYFGENLLVRTLHADCYKHNPQFLSF